MTLKYFPYFFWQLPSLWTRSESWTLFASWQIPPRLAFPARKHSLRDWESSSRIISWWKKNDLDSKTYSPPPSLARLICHTIVSETYPRQGWIRVPVVKVTQTFVLCSLKFRKSIKMFWIQTFSFLGVPDFRVYYMLQVWCACLFGRSFVCQQPSVEEESGREDNRLSPFNSTWLCCILSPGR